MSDNSNPLKLAQNLAIYCSKKGLTLTALARLSGVKQPTLHGWSTGRSVKNLKDLKKVCDVLEVDLHKILFGTPDPNNSGSELLEQLFKGEIQVTIKRITKETEHEV